MNLLEYGIVNIEDSTITAQNWGALGVDGVTDGQVNVKDSTINVTEQGYGSYAIGKCADTFTNCVFNINYGVVNFAAAADSTVTLENGTKGYSPNYYGIVTHQSMNGANSNIIVKDEGTQLNAKYGGIIAKATAQATTPPDLPFRRRCALKSRAWKSPRRTPRTVSASCRPPKAP